MGPADQSYTNPTSDPLPHCPYRGPEENGTFPCEAAEGAPVTASDCKSCPIPEAITYRQACLYLVPIREYGKTIFACRCFSTRYSLLAAKDWRHICSCHFWFPRGHRELALPLLAQTRNEYRRILRGQGPKPCDDVSAPARPASMHPKNPILRWLQWQRNWWLGW